MTEEKLLKATNVAKAILSLNQKLRTISSEIKNDESKSELIYFHERIRFITQNNNFFELVIKNPIVGDDPEIKEINNKLSEKLKVASEIIINDIEIAIKELDSLFKKL